MTSSDILIPAPVAELLDKISILEIKAEKIPEPSQLANVQRELGLLQKVRGEHIEDSAELEDLYQQLKGVNLALWDIEDDIRRLEDAGDFGEQFIQLARAVYKTNDQRAALKKAINQLLGSSLVEEKFFT